MFIGLKKKCLKVKLFKITLIFIILFKQAVIFQQRHLFLKATFYLPKIFQACYCCLHLPILLSGCYQFLHKYPFVHA